MANIFWDLPNICILTFLFGCKIKGLDFKCVVFFSSFVSSWLPHVLEENVRPKEADTEIISEQCITFLIIL